MRQRYSSKPEIPVPICVSMEIEGDPEPATGWIARLSVAGVDVETLHTPPIGSKIVFHAALNPESSEPLVFKGRVQWVAGARIGVQFGELGAKETYAIVEAMRVSTADAPPPMPPRHRAEQGLMKQFGGLNVFEGSGVTLVGAGPEEREHEIPIAFEEEA